MQYDSKDDRRAPFRLIDIIKPRCKELAAALGFLPHVIEVMVEEVDPVWYLLKEWLRGASQEGDPNKKPITWRTLIEALPAAKMPEEATILKTHFIFDSDTSSQSGELLVCMYTCNGTRYSYTVPL